MRGRRLAFLIVLLVAASASAQVGYPSAPVGHEVWTPASNELVKTVPQSGWDIPGPVNYFNLSCCGAETAKASMISTIPTYQVGLPGTTQGSQVTYTLTAGNRGAVGCEATNTCNCPDTRNINDSTDVDDLPDVTLSGGPFDGTYKLISNCRSVDAVTVSGPNMNIAIYGSYFDVLNVASDLPSSSHVIAVNSLFQSAGDADAVVNLNGGGILAYDEVIAGTDGVKVQQGADLTKPGATLYRTHVHGGDDEVVVVGKEPHHDMVQCQDGAHQIWLIESNLDGPYKRTQQAFRCVPENPGSYVGNVYVIKTYLGGSSQKPMVVSPKDICNGVPCGSFTMSNTERVYWSNRFVGNASEVSWTNNDATSSDNNNEDPCGGATDTLPTYATGNAATGDDVVAGLVSGTSPDLGDGWNASQCVAGQQAVTAGQQSAATTYAGDIEDYVTQIRTAAGASTAKSVSISSLTPANPTTDDDLTIVYSWSGFTPSAACTIAWTGANSASSPQVDAAPAGTELLATSLFNSIGTTNFTVSCPDGGNPPVVSSATARTFTAPVASVDFTTSPGDTTVTSGTLINLRVTVTGGSGTCDIEVDPEGDGTYVMNSGVNCSVPYDPVQTVTPTITQNYGIRVTRSGVTVTHIYTATVVGGAVHNDLRYMIWYDATKPFGQQLVAGDTSLGLLVISGNTYDRRVLGVCPRIGTTTSEYPNIGSYTGPGSLRMTLDGPSSTHQVWDETTLPYIAPATDRGWYSSGAGIAKAECGVGTVDFTVDGSYTVVGTPYDTNDWTGTPATGQTHSFTIAKLTAAAGSQTFTTADTPYVTYTVSGATDSLCDADFDGNGSYEVDCDETTNRCTAPGPMTQGSHDVAVRCQSGQIAHSVSVPIAGFAPPETLGGWLLAPAP